MIYYMREIYQIDILRNVSKESKTLFSGFHNKSLPSGVNNRKTMNTRLAANLSVIFTGCMLVLSFSFGFHNYSEAQKAIVSDLNQALQQTIMQNSGLWMNQDTLKTYSRFMAG